MTSVAIKTRSTDAVKAPATIRLVSSTISRSTGSPQVSRQTQTDTRSTAATARLSTLLSPSIQAATRVSSPNDPAEREAEATARAVMQMPSPQTPQITSPGAGIGRMAGNTQVVMRTQPVLARLHSSLLSRSSALSTSSDLSIQRVAMGSPTIATGMEQEIRAEMASGMPLPQDVRSFMEPRFRADFGAVRIHTDDKAARLSARLSARAFTYGKHIFFGKGQFRPNERTGAELIAHELTHTIQQREVIQRQEAVTVTEHSPVQVQRLGVGDALNYFADRANNIPGFRMFTIILGVNPINMRRVERSAANILRAVVEFIPGGALITQALDNHGVFDRVGIWVEQQIRTLAMTGSVIRDAINRFLDSLGWSDIFDLSGVWERAKRIFTEPIDRIISFAGGLVSGIIQFVKDAILTPLAQLASQTRGWDLLCAVLGRNPITGEAVPRNAETLIGGFMKLIGQEEVWENIKRGNAIARAWAWFQGALAGVLAFVQQIPSLFIQALRSLQLADIVLLPRAFARIARVFGSFALRFFSWAGQQVLSLLQIIFEVVAPGAMVYIRRAAGAFRTIIQNPIRFVGNLVRAGILGFRQFGRNFLTHLRTSLIGWLTGTMSGANIYIPQGFNLREIVKFVLSVLGLTWQNIRSKLVRVIGEPAVVVLERGFDIVMTLVREGPAAAWERIVESITNLRDMVMEQIMTFVRDRVVQTAITRLVTSLNPAGAFIQAIVATYNTIMFFVERLQQIAQVAADFIDSIASIASGVIAAAANRVEQTMGGLLTLVISFLARIAGLGRVSDAVVNIINRVRQPIDRALDRVVAWIRQRARNLLSRVLGGNVNATPQQRLQQGLAEATTAVNRLSGNRIGLAVIRPVLAVIRARHNMQRLDAEPRNGRWAVVGVVNPNGSELTEKLVDTTTVGAAQRIYNPINAAGFGTRATVTALTTIGNQNQPTAGNNSTWATLTKRLFRAGADSYYYVRGHLINGTFGGPGNDWRNLTPLTQMANNRSIASMLSTFENPVRHAVRTGGSADLDVTALYSSRGRSAIANRVRNEPTSLPDKSDAERGAIASLIDAEESVPSAVVANATIHRDGTSQRITSSTENVIDTELTHYYHRDYPPGSGAAARRVVNLNTADVTTLMRLTGVSSDIAQNIVNRRPIEGYRNRDDFTGRLGTEGINVWHMISSTAGVRLQFR